MHLIYNVFTIKMLKEDIEYRNLFWFFGCFFSKWLSWTAIVFWKHVIMWKAGKGYQQSCRLYFISTRIIVKIGFFQNYLLILLRKLSHLIIKYFFSISNWQVRKFNLTSFKINWFEHVENLPHKIVKWKRTEKH